MINISQSSWHFRLYEKFNDNTPKNLCQYTAGFLWILVICALLGVVFSVIGYGLFGLSFIMFYMPFFKFHQGGWWFIGGYVSFALLVWGIIRWTRSHSASVIGEYLRYKKQGICPKITLVD